MPESPGPRRSSIATIARTLSQGLQTVWPQPVLVENRTGGSQNIGADVVANSPKEFTAYIASEVKRWAKVIKDANIPAN